MWAVGGASVGGAALSQCSDRNRLRRHVASLTLAPFHVEAAPPEAGSQPRPERIADPQPGRDPALDPLPWRLTSFLRSLSLWMSQRTDTWGDFGKHSRKAVLFFTLYCVISAAFL